MIRLNLQQEQVQELERAFKSTPDRNMRDRVQGVLMVHRGRPREAIITDLCVSDRTITRWLNAYIERGLEGLRPGKAPGPSALIPESLAPLIRRWVIDGPVAAGLGRANWTYAELAAHLGREQHIKVKKSAMAEFCKRHEIRPYRPTYRFLRGNPVNQEIAAGELVELKKRRKTASSSC